VGEDLNYRQQAVVVAFFLSVGGVLLLIAWLARPNWVWDGPLVVAPAAGVACYPAYFLVERRGWWSRLGGHGLRVRGVPEKRVRRALRKVRRAVLADTLKLVARVFVVLAAIAITPLGLSANMGDRDLVRAGPVQQAEVVSVEQDRWSKDDALIVKVARPGDGASVELTGGDQLQPAPKVGDRVQVVVDPSDPSYVLAASVDLSIPWYAYLLYPVVSLIIGGFLSALTFATTRYPRRARWAFWRARQAAAIATVVDVRTTEASDEYPNPTYVTLETDGLVWRLVVEPFDPFVLEPGTRLPLAGDLRHRGWIICLTRPQLRPQEPIERRGT
jgi:hypothetical protein